MQRDRVGAGSASFVPRLYRVVPGLYMLNVAKIKKTPSYIRTKHGSVTVLMQGTPPNLRKQPASKNPANRRVR